MTIRNEAPAGTEAQNTTVSRYSPPTAEQFHAEMRAYAQELQANAAATQAEEDMKRAEVEEMLAESVLLRSKAEELRRDGRPIDAEVLQAETDQLDTNGRFAAHQITAECHVDKKQRKAAAAFMCKLDLGIYSGCCVAFGCSDWRSAYPEQRAMFGYCSRAQAG